MLSFYKKKKKRGLMLSSCNKLMLFYLIISYFNITYWRIIDLL